MNNQEFLEKLGETITVVFDNKDQFLSELIDLEAKDLLSLHMAEAASRCLVSLEPEAAVQVLVSTESILNFVDKIKEGKA